ncbi:hypothetical protein CYMTET_22295 [Cymbomonas tetramitiformis]|uniref:Uncharacterized protein n=1 Tax=Cymbomonas tetramitiformis TaxID=36881 RepID=A0AAE0FVF4_9CHLO|nr:hypothetical protein CYMTET_24658 [Cymbomonas tetramitiformis]KAK3269256.1 hypothetical protein CYMTET_22295 [Cymbomonas tetramitiformis]
MSSSHQTCLDILGLARARVRQGCEQILELLLDTGSALHYAVKGGRTELLERLLEEGAALDEVNEYGMRPLAYAAGVEDEAAALKMALFLLSRGAVVDSFAEDRHFRRSTAPESSTPLHEAAKAGHLAVARMLLEHGATTSVKDASGYHPFHLAAKHGHASVVHELCAHGVSTDSMTRDGLTASDLATADSVKDALRRHVKS